MNRRPSMTHNADSYANGPFVLVGPFQLADLAFEFLETITFRTRQAGALSLVALRLPNPFTQGLPCAADFSRDRDDRRPLRLVLPLVIEHHPNSPLTELR